MRSAGSRRLESFLEKKGWNYERLAVDIGARSTTVYRWLTARTEPQPVWRKLLKDKYGIDWD